MTQPELVMTPDGGVEVRTSDGVTLGSLRDLETYLDGVKADPRTFRAFGRVAAVLAAVSKPGFLLADPVHIDKLVDGYYSRFPDAARAAEFAKGVDEASARIASLNGEIAGLHRHLRELNAM